MDRDQTERPPIEQIAAQRAAASLLEIIIMSLGGFLLAAAGFMLIMDVEVAMAVIAGVCGAAFLSTGLFIRAMERSLAAVIDLLRHHEAASARAAGPRALPDATQIARAVSEINESIEFEADDRRRRRPAPRTA